MEKSGEQILQEHMQNRTYVASCLWLFSIPGIIITTSDVGVTLQRKGEGDSIYDPTLVGAVTQAMVAGWGTPGTTVFGPWHVD